MAAGPFSDATRIFSLPDVCCECKKRIDSSPQILSCTVHVACGGCCGSLSPLSTSPSSDSSCGGREWLLCPSCPKTINGYGPARFQETVKREAEELIDGNIAARAGKIDPSSSSELSSWEDLPAASAEKGQEEAMKKGAATAIAAMKAEENNVLNGMLTFPDGTNQKLGWNASHDATSRDLKCQCGEDRHATYRGSNHDRNCRPEVVDYMAAQLGASPVNPILRRDGLVGPAEQRPTYCNPAVKPRKVIQRNDPDDGIVKGLNLIKLISQILDQIPGSMDAIVRVIQEVEHRLLIDVAKHIKDLSRGYVMQIETMENDLLVKLQEIGQIKGQTLYKQMEDLGRVQTSLNNLRAFVVKGLESADERAISRYPEIYSALVSTFHMHFSNLLQPYETANISWIASNVAFESFINGFKRSMSTKGFGPKSEVFGIPGIGEAVLAGKLTSFNVQVRDYFGEKSTGVDPLTVLVQHREGGRLLEVQIRRYTEDGVYQVLYMPLIEGRLHISVTLRGLHVKGSPFEVKVRDLWLLGKAVRVIGSEGGGDGELCRPWGVAYSKDGYLAVGDRSNHCIQIFGINGAFVHKFGSEGERPGQLKRPAGVAFNSQKHIVVADKDNHRIQIFTFTGKFVHCFGEHGNAPGQFEYPWDVAVDSNDRILVSDARNQRVQLFTSDGHFLCLFGQRKGKAGQLKKKVDSPWGMVFDHPRGVAFLPDGRVIVTEFNRHGLVILSCSHSLGGGGSILHSPKFMGGEARLGEDDAKAKATAFKKGVGFYRPEGVAVDNLGLIYVADSRNHQIQVLDTDFTYLRSLKMPRGRVDKLNKPNGICVTAEGRVAAVDFENNRVVIFLEK